MKDLTQKDIQSVCEYFHIFDYAPSFDQIYRYVPTATSKKDLKKTISGMIRTGELISDKNNRYYALRGHSAAILERPVRKRRTTIKLQKAYTLTRILRLCPWVYMIGVSGSCAVYNARESDDIDVFIVSAPRRIWLSRITTILVAELMRSRRRRGMRMTRDTLCLNMFFDARDLAVPEDKRNMYTAHEVTQLKLMYDRGGIYRNFIIDNIWVKNHFPNMSLPNTSSRNNLLNLIEGLLNFIVFPLEFGARSFQKLVMKHPTTERISNTQLWFFPEDFEHEVRKHYSID